MVPLHPLEATEERVILIAVELDDNTTDACLDELEELVKTAGGVCVARAIQKREKIHAGHYIGKGKIEEIKEFVEKRLTF